MVERPKLQKHHSSSSVAQTGRSPSEKAHNLNPAGPRARVTPRVPSYARNVNKLHGQRAVLPRNVSKTNLRKNQSETALHKRNKSTNDEVTNSDANGTKLGREEEKAKTSVRTGEVAIPPEYRVASVLRGSEVEEEEEQEGAEVRARAGHNPSYDHLPVYYSILNHPAFLSSEPSDHAGETEKERMEREREDQKVEEIRMRGMQRMQEREAEELQMETKKHETEQQGRAEDTTEQQKTTTESAEVEQSHQQSTDYKEQSTDNKQHQSMEDPEAEQSRDYNEGQSEGYKEEQSTDYKQASVDESQESLDYAKDRSPDINKEQCTDYKTEGQSRDYKPEESEDDNEEQSTDYKGKGKVPALPSESTEIVDETEPAPLSALPAEEESPPLDPRSPPLDSTSPPPTSTDPDPDPIKSSSQVGHNAAATSSTSTTRPYRPSKSTTNLQNNLDRDRAFVEQPQYAYPPSAWRDHKMREVTPHLTSVDDPYYKKYHARMDRIADARLRNLKPVADPVARSAARLGIDPLADARVADAAERAAELEKEKAKPKPSRSVMDFGSWFGRGGAKPKVEETSAFDLNVRAFRGALEKMEKADPEVARAVKVEIERKAAEEVARKQKEKEEKAQW